MGYTMLKFNGAATLSRHNSARDVEHNALWEELCNRIEALVEEEKYKPIIADYLRVVNPHTVVAVIEMYDDMLASWRRLDVTHREAQAEIAEANDRIVELESVLMGHSGRCPYTKNACERRKGEVERLSKLVDALTNALRDAVGTETTLRILRRGASQ